MSESDSEKLLQRSLEFLEVNHPLQHKCVLVCNCKEQLVREIRKYQVDSGIIRREIPLTADMAKKIWEDIHKLVTLDCGCVVDGNTVGLCAKHYGNWRVSLGPRKTEEMNKIDALLEAQTSDGEPAVPTEER